MNPAERTVRYWFNHGIGGGRVDRREGPVEFDWPHVRGERNTGFVDAIGVVPASLSVPAHFLLVQATVPEKINNRLAKIIERAHFARQCLEAGAQIEVWGWPKDPDAGPVVRAVNMTDVK